MTRISEDLADFGQIESEPEFEGRQVIMVLAPKKKIESGRFLID